MGLRTLLLARPQASPADPDAIARAASSCQILEESATYPDLAAALASHQRAYAFTARRRGMSHLVLDVRATGLQAAEDLASNSRVAFVFGPERSGLSNAETELCDAIVEIPTAAKRSSLNVAAAVQLACYELFMAQTGQATLPERDLATKGEIQGVLDHLEELVQGTCPPRDQALADRMRSRLQLLLNRASPAKADVRLLRGLLRGIAEANNPDRKQ